MAERTKPELRSDVAVQQELRRLAGETPLPDDYFKEVFAGKLREDQGRGAALVLKLMLKFRLPTEHFVKYRDAFKKSLSDLTWNQIVQVYPQYKTPHMIPLLTQDVWYVSDKFLEDVLAAMWKAEKTTVSLVEVKKESELVHWMSAVVLEIANYFEGAVRNEPEKSMRGSLSQGRVEFVWVAVRLCVLIVLEMNASGFDTDNYAQIMAELEAGAYSNVLERISVDTIYGLLANKDGWIFVEYYPNLNQFKISRALQVDDRDPDCRVQNRCTGIRLLWGLFVKGYCKAVGAMQQRSKATLEQVEDELRLLGAEGYTEASISARRRPRIVYTRDQLEQEMKERKDSSAKWDATAQFAFQALRASETAQTDQDFEKAVRCLH
ncbi:hypothetical protein BC832DRAFT_251525 [Gaertneriomyces semiglobifer]|nr:hypothetical protein BC832DRAFT_251525 [Gaertneriomyces semiglobifer]